MQLVNVIATFITSSRPLPCVLSKWFYFVPFRPGDTNLTNGKRIFHLLESNDYLEEVEDTTFNLIEGIDVAAIEAKIAKYQEENAEQIIISRARKADELAAALRASQNVGHDDPADGGAGPGSQDVYNCFLTTIYCAALPGAGLMQPRPTGMAPQPVPVGASLEPLHGYAAEDEATMKLRFERGARAGGWTIELSKMGDRGSIQLHMDLGRAIQQIKDVGLINEVKA